ncbi:hypothetical protein VTN00DRAFT_1684 [Thermoascus crustaceus]|uniref:uncharacterized protein n=1 Tax=Thermoascus crustaceus TaxID=5088 RepID=UPI0037430A80
MSSRGKAPGLQHYSQRLVEYRSTLTFSDYLLAAQPVLRFHPEVDTMEGSFPVLLFMKDLAFTLVDLTETPSLLKSLKIGDAPEPELDQGWNPSFCGCMYYVQLDQDSGEYPYTNHLLFE